MKKEYRVALFTSIAVFLLFLVFLFWDGASDNGILTLYGNVDIREANVGFRVFGRVDKLHVEEGDGVSKGQIIAELDATPYILNLQEAEARIISIEQSLSYAIMQTERRLPLLETQSVSKEEFEQVDSNRRVLEANLKEARAAYENAKVSLEDTLLRSPSDGVIYTRIREPGTIVDKGAPIYSIAVNRPIWVRTYVPENRLGDIRPGMRAEIYTDTKRHPFYEGQIGFISPIAEFTPKTVETPDLRTSLVYQVRVVINAPDASLRQGMPVTVKIPLQ